MNKEVIKGSNITEMVVKGSVWVAIARITEKTLYFIRLIIIARILSPEDLGLFGVALLTLTFLENFSQLGIYQSLIQKSGNIKSYLNTAWTTVLVRNIILGLILIIISNPLANFFGEPSISPLIKVLSIFIFIQGFYNICIIYFQKNFEFNKQFYYQFFSTLIDTIVTIIFALIFKNVCALVI